MSILSSAELLLQAKNYSGTGDWQDESGNDHHAQLGSTSGADTNDPLFKSFAGEQYVFLPGLSGNYLSTPDAAALDLLGDIWVAGRFALDDWTPASDQTLIAKWEDTSDERAYRLMVDTTGVLRFGWSTDGTAANAVSSDSTAAPTVVNGDALWCAGTLEVSSGDVKFYTGGAVATPVWTQLGTTVSGAGATSIGATTAVLEVGSDNTGTAQFLIGEVYDAHVEDGYDEGIGTLQFDMSATTPTEPFATFTETSANAATVTINRTGTVLLSTVVDRNMFLLTTDDYFLVPDDAALDFDETEALTLMVMFRLNIVPAAAGQLAIKKQSGQAGYRMFANSGSNLAVDIHNGESDTVASLSIHTLHSGTLVRNIVDADVEGFIDGVGSGSPTADAQVTLVKANELAIGSRVANGDHFLDGEILAVVLWRKALTDDEISDAHTLLTSTAVGSRLLLLGVP